MPNTKFQQYRVFLQNGLVEKKLKAVENYFQNLKKKLGLDPNLVTCDEQDIISALQVAFKGEKNTYSVMY